MLTATEQREVVELAREFAKEKIEPFAAEWDRTCEFPRNVIDELGKLVVARIQAVDGITRTLTCPVVHL